MLDADVDDRAWRQANLSIKRAGLGIRAAEDHAAAAFLASTKATSDLCVSIDPDFDVGDAQGHLHLDSTRNEFSDQILPDAVTEGHELGHKQKHLSALVDAKLERSLKTSRQADAAYRAHLSLQTLHGAGAWLLARPVDEACTMESELFKTAV